MNDDEKKSQAWQAWGAAILAIIAVGSIIYSQSSVTSANTVTLQNHSAQIADLQNTTQKMQDTLSDMDAKLSAITQKLDDLQAEGKQ